MATAVSQVEFGPASNSSDEFIVTDQGSGTARVRTGTAIPLTSSSAFITGVWTFDNGFSLDGDTFTSLTGTGLAFSGGALTSVLGTDIDTSEIVNGTIATADIASNAVTSSLILDGTIVANDIANGTLTFSKLGQNGCSPSQVISWNGSAWACANDADTDTNTTYSAGSGLSLSGTTFSIDGTVALFKTIDAPVGTDPVADSLTDTLTLNSGNGITVTGDAAADAVNFSLNIAAGSGLAFSGGALTLQSCAEGQILKYTSGSWVCAADNTAPAASYKQQLAGTDNVTIGSSFTPLLTNGSGTAQSLGIAISAGNEVSFNATAQVSSTLATGLMNYVVVRDDNHDNDCVTGGGDGTQVGGPISGFVATVAQPFAISFAFNDTAPVTGTNYYQLCASTSIAIGTATATLRALKLNEINL